MAQEHTIEMMETNTTLLNALPHKNRIRVPGGVNIYVMPNANYHLQ